MTIIFNNLSFIDYDDFKIYLEENIYQENGFYKIKIIKGNYCEIPYFRRYDKLWTYLHYLTFQIEKLYINLT